MDLPTVTYRRLLVSRVHVRTVKICFLGQANFDQTAFLRRLPWKVLYYNTRSLQVNSCVTQHVVYQSFERSTGFAFNPHLGRDWGGSCFVQPRAAWCSLMQVGWLIMFVINLMEQCGMFLINVQVHHRLSRELGLNFSRL